MKKIGVTVDDAAKIVDELMFKGGYTKTYKLTAKTNVTFRTRGVQNHDTLQDKIEEVRPAYMGTISLMMSKMNLAASLASLGNRSFKLNKEDEPEEALKFVKRMPYPIFNLLLQKLTKFDELVMTVMDEGAIENF